jgi:hypothetical protein
VPGAAEVHVQAAVRGSLAFHAAGLVAAGVAGLENKNKWIYLSLNYSIIFGGPALHFFQIMIFMCTTLLTGMTSISLHMHWPLTSRAHGSFLKENSTPFNQLII